MSTSTPDLKAKRTHASRTCSICKVRKTRCELPDLDVASSSTPLPPEKSCHRCQALSLPCVVDDVGIKLKSTPKTSASSSSSSASRSAKRFKEPRASIGSASDLQVGELSPNKKQVTSKRKRIKHQQEDNSGTTQNDHHDGDDASGQTGSAGILKDGELAAGSRKKSGGDAKESVDVLHGFRLEENDRLGGKGDVMPPFGSTAPVDSPQSKSMKLHGRPLELVCAMLSVAYGKKGTIMRGMEVGNDVDLNKAVGMDLRHKLSHGVTQLQTFHPWLESLQSLFHAYSSDPSPCIKLLLATVLYLSTLTIPTDKQASQLRTTLTPLIGTLRDDVMIQLPRSLHAAQALELLSLHAPLGVLPLQHANPRSLSVARGHATAAAAILASLRLPEKVRPLTQYQHLPAAFVDKHVWTWLTVCADEAAMALEDEATLRPASLDEAKYVVDGFLSPDKSDIWKDGSTNPAVMIGRLATCDRISRLASVHDSLAGIRRGLDISATDSIFDLIASSSQVLRALISHFEEIDRVHDNILGLLSPTSGGIEAGWLAYRKMRTRFSANKVNCVGLRMFLASAYMPGGSQAFAGLPTHLNPEQKVSYALARAYNPPDILPVIVSPTSAACRATWHWGAHRGELCKVILQDFVDISTLILPPSTSTSQDGGGPNIPQGYGTTLVPLQDSACMVVESCKVLMEMQRGSILMIQKSGQALATGYEIPHWYEVLRQVCEAAGRIGEWSHGTNEDRQQGRWESVPQGCAKLLDSMRRMGHEYVRGVGRTGETPKPPVQAGNTATPVGSGGEGAGIAGFEPKLETLPPLTRSDHGSHAHATHHPPSLPPPPLPPPPPAAPTPPQSRHHTRHMSLDGPPSHIYPAAPPSVPYSPHPHQLTYPEYHGFPGQNIQSYQQPGNENPQQHQHHPQHYQQSSVPSPVSGYMDSSDRWMAGAPLDSHTHTHSHMENDPHNYSKSVNVTMNNHGGDPLNGHGPSAHTQHPHDPSPQPPPHHHQYQHHDYSQHQHQRHPPPQQQRSQQQQHHHQPQIHHQDLTYHPPPDPDTDPSGQSQSDWPSAPTALDLLLSQMFNYPTPFPQGGNGGGVGVTAQSSASHSQTHSQSQTPPPQLIPVPVSSGTSISMGHDGQAEVVQQVHGSHGGPNVGQMHL